jgi:DNA-binding NarL/FixJ family response regulator
VVGTVSDGRALLKAAADLTPDVVVVDIGMPLLNGLDAGEQLKALHPHIKVITSRQNREPRFAIEAFRRHASAYLLKDSAASELTTAIRDALRGKTYVSSGHRERHAGRRHHRDAARIKSRYATSVLANEKCSNCLPKARR